MFDLFKRPALTRKQRFEKAIIVSITVALVGSLLRIAIFKYMNFDSGLLYIALGWLIGYSIQFFGKGVQIQFSILAAVLTALSIFVCDLLLYNGIQSLIIVYSSIYVVIYRLLAIYVAFYFARA